MSRPRAILEKVAAMIFPWPARHERHAAITAARREREYSEAAAGRAQEIEQAIRRMAEENHFAARIAEQIIRGAR